MHPTLQLTQRSLLQQRLTGSATSAATSAAEADSDLQEIRAIATNVDSDKTAAEEFVREAREAARQAQEDSEQVAINTALAQHFEVLAANHAADAIAAAAAAAEDSDEAAASALASLASATASAASAAQAAIDSDGASLSACRAQAYAAFTGPCTGYWASSHPGAQHRLEDGSGNIRNPNGSHVRFTLPGDADINGRDYRVYVNFTEIVEDDSETGVIPAGQFDIDRILNQTDITFGTAYPADTRIDVFIHDTDGTEIFGDDAIPWNVARAEFFAAALIHDSDTTYTIIRDDGNVRLVDSHGTETTIVRGGNNINIQPSTGILSTLYHSGSGLINTLINGVYHLNIDSDVITRRDYIDPILDSLVDSEGMRWSDSRDRTTPVRIEDIIIDADTGLELDSDSRGWHIQRYVPAAFSITTPQDPAQSWFDNGHVFADKSITAVEGSLPATGTITAVETPAAQLDIILGTYPNYAVSLHATAFSNPGVKTYTLTTTGTDTKGGTATASVTRNITIYQDYWIYTNGGETRYQADITSGTAITAQGETWVEVARDITLSFTDNIGTIPSDEITPVNTTRTVSGLASTRNYHRYNIGNYVDPHNFTITIS